MTFLRLCRGQSFLAAERTGYWSFPVEIVRVDNDTMVVRQCVFDGSENEYTVPEHQDTEIKIVLEPELVQFVYVYDLGQGKC